MDTGMGLPEQLSKEYFLENLKQTGGPTRDPEKYNLYMGLFEMAQVLETMSLSLSKLERDFARFRSRFQDPQP